MENVSHNRSATLMMRDVGGVRALCLLVKLNVNTANTNIGRYRADRGEQKDTRGTLTPRWLGIDDVWRSWKMGGDVHYET